MIGREHDKCETTEPRQARRRARHAILGPSPCSPCRPASHAIYTRAAVRAPLNPYKRFATRALSVSILISVHILNNRVHVLFRKFPVSYSVRARDPSQSAPALPAGAGPLAGWPPCAQDAPQT